MVKPTKLRPKDLQPGDSIRVTFTDRGVLSTREGTFSRVERINVDPVLEIYYNDQDGILFSPDDENVDIELLARPGDEPTGLGAVVSSWHDDRDEEVFSVHLGDHVWCEAGVPTRTYSWADIAAPVLRSEGWKP